MKKEIICKICKKEIPSKEIKHRNILYCHECSVKNKKTSDKNSKRKTRKIKKERTENKKIKEKIDKAFSQLESEERRKILYKSPYLIGLSENDSHLIGKDPFNFLIGNFKDNEKFIKNELKKIGLDEERIKKLI